MRGQLDGIVARRLNQPYRSGERAIQKITTIRTAACVVGGFRYASAGKAVGSLLLGLHDNEGLINHAGFASPIASPDKKALAAKLEAPVESESKAVPASLPAH